MTVTVEIPDELAATAGKGEVAVSRAFLEAFALEGYRCRRMSEYQVRQLLGFHTCDEVHGFFKRNGVYLQYSLEDAEHDLAVARQYREMQKADQTAGLNRR